MPDPVEPSGPLPGASQCSRCSDGLLKLRTILPCFEPHPKYYIFQCLKCGFIEWVPKGP
jgi:hypothetical protein